MEITMMILQLLVVLMALYVGHFGVRIWTKTRQSAYGCYLYHHRRRHLRGYHAGERRYGLADSDRGEAAAETSEVHHHLSPSLYLLPDRIGRYGPRGLYVDAYHL